MKTIFKRYWIFLLLIVLISYGQLTKMYVWQDDNALFFKLAHIQEQAGYLGRGLFGEYIYKYIAFYYYPIYLLFKFNTVAYFSYAIFFYFLATVSIYKVSSYVIGSRAAKVASFLFACGYIAADGFVRLYNSVPTSISIILASFLFYFYWKFYKKKKLIFYFLALAFYFLSIEFVMSRTAYLVFVPFLFEVIFLFSPRKILYSILRLLPFLLLFYQHFLLPADPRSNGILFLVKEILKGNISAMKGFLISTGNVFFPDWLKMNGNFLIAAVLIIVIVLFLIRRRMVFFLLLWILVNIFSYSAYNPDFIHATDHRYLAHSFLPIVLLFGFLFSTYRNRVLKVLIILWGVGNLIFGFLYLNRIVKSRSEPVISFYEQLKKDVPNVKKGDIFYFDLAEDSRSHFDDAFSVAQMPEETAIAWRYGVDRYEIKMCSDYKCLIEARSDDKWKNGNLYTFFYKKGELVDTRKLFTESGSQLDVFVSSPMASRLQMSHENSGTVWSAPELEIPLKNPVVSVSPVEFNFRLSATIYRFTKADFPLLSHDYLTIASRVGGNIVLNNLVFEYKKAKDTFRKTTKFSVGSEWQDRIVGNLIDGDPETIWQGDRLLWIKKPETITIEMAKKEVVNRIAWVNGFPDHTPTKFFLENSEDGVKWKLVENYTISSKVNRDVVQEISFPSMNTKFLRLTFEKTFNNDSPTIGELWVIQSIYAGIKINDAERFLNWPFLEVGGLDSYMNIINGIGRVGKIQVYWWSNKHDAWQTENDAKIDLVYDNIIRNYKVIVPAGGTNITKIKLKGVQIPGNINIY